MSTIQLNYCHNQGSLDLCPIDTSRKKLRIVWQVVGQVSAKIFQFFFEVQKNWEKLDEEACNFFRRRKKPKELHPITGPYKYYDKGFGVDIDNAKPSRFVTENGETLDKIAFIGMNGVRVNLPSAKMHADFLSKYLNKKITFIHNPSLGAIRDTYRYALEAFCRWITPASILLKKEIVKELNRGKEVLLFPHSAGVPAVRNALLLLNPKQRSKVHVIAAASSIFMDPSLGGSVVNIISPIDPVPFFDIKGMHKFKHTIEWVPPSHVKNFHGHYLDENYGKIIRKHTDHKITEILARSRAARAA